MNTKEAHQKVGVTHNAPLLGLPVQYKAGSNGKENMQKKSEFKRIPYAAPNTPISTEASSSEISFSGIWCVNTYINRTAGRVPKPAPRKTEQFILPHGLDVEASCGSQWVTEYMESFGFPQLPRPAPPKKPAPPKASFRKLQRPPHPRTEYQTVFGPKDLTFVHLGNPDLIDGKINFSKRWQQFNILDSMRRFQQVHYELKRNDDIVAFFNDFSDHLAEEALWELSLKIKPRNITRRRTERDEKT
ncbi:hypothetical protein KOW79_015310 [Hemibagrus wyckioides]|uniref:Ras-GEF domain-containing protein n=1 Tax=Hemibagrus wyckioides TaxID=337641 RepID=A0A9D3NH34_9TELE|nr:hypothetical protein KOW79_015310 [Hemibagrus wyckioides]